MKRIIPFLALMSALALLLAGCVNMEFMPSRHNQSARPNEPEDEYQSTPETHIPSVMPGYLYLERYEEQGSHSDIHDMFGLYNECSLFYYEDSIRIYEDNSNEPFYFEIATDDETLAYGGDHVQTQVIEALAIPFFTYRGTTPEGYPIQFFVDDTGRVRHFEIQSSDPVVKNNRFYSSDEIRPIAKQYIRSITGADYYQIDYVGYETMITGGESYMIYMISAYHHIGGHLSKDAIHMRVAANGTLLEFSTDDSYGMFDEKSEFPFSMIDVQELMRKKATTYFTYGYEDLGADYYYMITLEGKKALWINITATVYDEYGQAHDFRDVWVAHFGH